MLSIVEATYTNYLLVLAVGEQVVHCNRMREKKLSSCISHKVYGSGTAHLG